MTDRRTETKDKLLATMRAVSPPLEKLMAERVALRNEIRTARSALADTERQIALLLKVRDVRIPSYIAYAKAITLTATMAALAALALSLFTNLIEIKITASLFASFLIPLWLVERAEQQFGRWHMRLYGASTFVRSDG